MDRMPQDSSPRAARGQPRTTSDAATMIALSALAQQSRRMTMPVTTPAPNAGQAASGAVDESMRPAAIAGWTIIAIFFGCFGAWAMTAPLNGAVVANAVVK